MIDIFKIYKQQDNKLLRIEKREKKQENYYKNGLNGERAVLRRWRQLYDKK